MVDEYLDEREQAEWLKNLFKEYWLALVAGVGLALGGFWAFQAWQNHLDRRSQQAAAQFTQMLETIDSQGSDAGLALVDPLVEKYGRTPYADQARLVAARLHVDAGRFDEAAARLRQVMEGSKDPELALVARLRLARVESAAGRHDAALALLDRAEAPEIAGRVDELRGDVLFAKGDRDGALAAYRRARDAAAGPEAAGMTDPELLALKIDALEGPAPAEAAPPAPAPAAGE